MIRLVPRVVIERWKESLMVFKDLGVGFIFVMGSHLCDLLKICNVACPWMSRKRKWGARSVICVKSSPRLFWFLLLFLRNYYEKRHVGNGMYKEMMKTVSQTAPLNLSPSRNISFLSLSSFSSSPPLHSLGVSGCRGVSFDASRVLMVMFKVRKE